MSFKEFGTIVEPAKSPGTFKEFGEPIQPISRTKSLLHAAGAGAVEKAGDIAGLFHKIAPFLPKGELTKESAYKYSKEKLPHFEKEPEKFLKRTGGIAVEAMLTPGGPITKGVQTLVGSTLGHAAEKLGAPEWAQSIAEGLPFFFSAGKKIPLKTDQKKLGEFMRNQGLTENEITPLLKTPEQINRWSKWASKGKKNRKLMEAIYQKSGKIYDSISDAASALPAGVLNPREKQTFLTAVNGIKQQMPHKYRNLIKQDLKDFEDSAGHFNDLTNLYRDINAVIGAEPGGKAIVGQFKAPITRGMESISPQLADDFRLANDLYRTRAHIKSALVNPKDFDKFLDLGEMYALGQGVANRDIGMIGKVVSAAGARKIAREMLINPRLQNISMRVGEALKQNKLILVEKLMNEFNEEAKKSDPELANDLP